MVAIRTLPSSLLPELVKAYLDGDSVTDLAKLNRLDRNTIYRFLFKGCGEEWYDIVTQGLIQRVADADAAMSLAHGKENIARAIAWSKLCRMDLERLRPKLYGTRFEVEVRTLDLNRAIEEAQARSRHRLPSSEAAAITVEVAPLVSNQKAEVETTINEQESEGTSIFD